jgi:5-methylcytosine-specific restriction protein A
MKKKLCAHPGCGALVDHGVRYCPAHLRVREDSPARAFGNAARSNQGLYNTSRWRKLAALVIREQPFCWYCGISKRDAGSLEVHHVEPPRGNEAVFFDRNNLVAVCRHCHQVITNKEIAGRRNR